MNTQGIARIAMLLVWFAASAFTPLDAHAQRYPSKPISWLVPAGPGTGNDVIARIIAQKISASMGQPVLIENRPGASGAIAIEMAAKAAPDGYTIAIPSTSHILIQYVSRVRYDLVKDFAPITLCGSLPYVIAASTSLPVKSVSELVALAKASPGKVNYTGVTGQISHFMGDMLKSAAGVDIMMIPYKSTADAETDVVAGRVEIWFTTMASALPQAKAGKVRILAVAGEKRAAVLPEVPTIVEAGLPTLDVSASFFIVAPAGTPSPVIKVLNSEIVKAIASKEVSDRLAAAGVQPRSGSPEELGALLRSEAARWSKIIKDSGVRAD